MAAQPPPVPTGFTALTQLTSAMDPTIAAQLQPVLYALQVQFQAIALSLGLSATTAATTGDRPTAKQLQQLPDSGIGFSMVDLTLGIPIWVLSNNGTVVGWINSTGGAV